MTSDITGLERFPTDIPGLDPILEGGLLRGGVYMIQGSPGAGKTVLGNQACFAHAARGGRAVYVTLLAESHQRMLAHMRRMTFFRPEMVPDRVAYLSAFKVLEAEGLAGLLTSLRKAVTSREATLLVLDGLVSAEEASPSARDFKKFIHELQIVTAMTECTAILLSSTERPRAFRPEHTMVDGIIELGDELTNLRSLRWLLVRKMRGCAPVRGRHTLEISDDGIAVRPRFESRLAGRIAEHAEVPDDSRLGFGIARLDQMLRGGLPAGSMTMLLGPTGVGKTTLGLQFVVDGVERGESGVYFGFFERPAALAGKSRRLNLGLEEGIRRGLVEVAWQRPVEGVIDSLGERLLSLVRRRRARRLCIDGMQGFQASVDAPGRMHDVFSALADELGREGVTTVYTLETTDLLGPQIEVPIQGLSALTHNIIILRHVELDARLYQLLSILKVRDSDYDNRISEFRITDDGLRVIDTFEDAHQVLSGSARTSRSREGSRAPRPKKGGLAGKRPPPRRRR